MIEIASSLTLATLFGGMVGFSFLFSPLVFIRLPIEVAGPFIRQVFPAYFAAVAALFALGAVLSLSQPLIAVVLLAMSLLGALNLFGLMPAINRLRDRELAGDATAKKRFDLLHRLSVAINFIQILAAGWAIAAL
ncbi:DUF4149 domain-containing protein [Pontivivens ytuae]|uniref:DUF4149 domain-containing protein n=1 Tax=Pontivivens ytuae TaxID=2789856 RepID=A0A7S9LV97_9RHOB|nr:DUF4149 domain-containing protein [Pontivivens ytuae]QPH55966.1 DUF4149 domain-containing protein [Pontivivens ytuae]